MVTLPTLSTVGFQKPASTHQCRNTLLASSTSGAMYLFSVEKSSLVCVACTPGYLPQQIDDNTDLPLQQACYSSQAVPSAIQKGGPLGRPAREPLPCRCSFKWKTAPASNSRAAHGTMLSILDSKTDCTMGPSNAPQLVHSLVCKGTDQP
jgi:hypothetical protein